MYYLTQEELNKKQIKKEYPECANCSFLEKRKTDTSIYCFYRIKEECLLKNR